MFNIKKRSALLGLSLCMAIGMAGCDKKAASSDIPEDALMLIDPSEKKQISYKTYTLEVSDYNVPFGAVAYAKYEEEILYADIPYGTPIPVGYLAKSNQMVEEGTPILQYRLLFDELYMETKRIELKRNTERFAVYKTEEEASLAEALESVGQLPADSEAYAEALEDYNERLTAYQKQVKTKQEEIDQLTKEVAMFEFNDQMLMLRSTAKGRFAAPANIRYLADGVEIARVRKPFTNIYAVDSDVQEDSDASINRYMVGQKVVGDYRDESGTEYTVEGRVLSVDSILPTNLQSNSAYIWFDFPEDMTETPASIHVTVDTVHIKNVIRVPKDITQTYNQTVYIELLTDEGIIRENLNVFSENSTEYIILDTTLGGRQAVKR